MAAFVEQPPPPLQMDPFELRYRHQPRVHPHWMLLIAAVASLAMLVLASMLAGLPLR